MKFALMWANHDWRNYFPVPKDQQPTLWLPSRASPPDFARLMQYCRQNYVTTYNLTASGKASLPGHPLDRYTDLVEAHLGFWTQMDTGLLPYWPVVTIGWDPSPRWAPDAPFPPVRSDYPYGTLVVSNTPAEFGRLCQLALQRAENSRLRPSAILSNAWNEWTEGSALLPSTAFGTNYLETLKARFGSR